MSNKKSTKIILTSIFCNFMIFNMSVGGVFVCKDSSGNVLYTDAPEKNVDCVSPIKKEIPPLPSYNSKEGLPTNKKSPAGKVADINSSEGEVTKLSPSSSSNDLYSAVSIVTPANGETVNSCPGILNVVFSVEPDLFSGDVAELYIDGAQKATGTTKTFTVPEVERGNHMLAVKITRNNAVIESSQTVGINFLRNCAAQVQATRQRQGGAP